jgi:predicted nucleic acid-binding protein
MNHVAGDEVELALADTSMFIAQEQDREVTGSPPRSVAVSVITVAELRLGVLAAADGSTRAQRLETLSRVEELDPLPVDARVAHAWAALRLALRDAGKRMPVNDSWIAATALANNLPVASQDSDYDVVRGLQVLKL